MLTKKQFVLISLIVLIILVFLFRVFLGNLFSLATGRGYFIPEESNMFVFNVTKMNTGSGEWWLYGEDKLNYYALADDAPGYFVLKKTDLPDGVSELDKKSWGSAAVFVSTP